MIFGAEAGQSRVHHAPEPAPPSSDAGRTASTTTTRVDPAQAARLQRTMVPLIRVMDHPMPLDQVKVDINRELERKFPPEFRNRIDEIVLFQPLTKVEVREIALKYIEQVSATLTSRPVSSGRSTRIFSTP